MTKFNKIILSFLLLSWMSCPQQYTYDSSNYFPSQSDNEWHYDMRGSGNATMIKKIVCSSFNEFTIITKIILENLEPVSILSIFKYDNNMIVETGSGGGLLNTKFKYYSEPSIIIKYPIILGSKWKYTENGGRRFELSVYKFLDSLNVGNFIFYKILIVKQTLHDGKRFCKA